MVTRKADFLIEKWIDKRNICIFPTIVCGIFDLTVAKNQNDEVCRTKEIILCVNKLLEHVL